MYTKFQILGTLDTHANNLRLASLLRVLARSSDLEVEFRKAIGLRRPEVFEPSLGLLADKPKFIDAVDQMYFAIVRTAVTEALDLTREYCETTGQSAILKRQSWFRVFRIIRNALNHNFRLEFNPTDRKLLPLTWKTICLTNAQDGKELTQKMFPVDVAIDWLTELDDFVSEGIK